MGGRIPSQPDEARCIVLASRSPRRRALLEAAGWQVDCRPAPVDDGLLHPGSATPEAWTQALAWYKARAVALLPASRPGELLLGADTVCAVDDTILGQPTDADHARAMLHSMRGRSHEVLTGMCLHRVGGVRRLALARATVTFGELGDDAVEAYLASEDWRGKAGGYNLSDRMQAGWPLTCDGEPEAVMGLSMTTLERLWHEVAA